MKNKHWIILILILAASLRLYGLERGDTLNDEVFYGFRAAGLMDFDEAADQTTPLEWFDPSANPERDYIPSWTKLSFHDHPPLVFWIQHVSILLFGENNFAMRFPSALLGVLSVYLIYLVGRRLYSSSAGLIASMLAAATLNSVYISRTGMQEAYVIFFILLASFFFLKSMEKEKYLIWTGAALGFGFLAKYNTFVLAPIFLAYLALFRRDYFLNKKMWIGAFLALIIFSPVIIYNFQLYGEVGHFDFQFSYIFGQNPDVWKVAPGKEIGTLTDRMRDFLPNLLATNSWLFLASSAVSLLAGFAWFLRKPKTFLKKNAFLLIAVFYLLMLLAAIGPSYRFLTMLTPFMALGAAILFYYIYTKFLSKYFRIAILLFAGFIAFEVFYAYNNQIAYYPNGPEPWLSSNVRSENYNLGYNNLAGYFNEELREKVPAITFRHRYSFVEKAQEKSIERGLDKNYTPYPAMIITYGDFDPGAKLWTLDRLHIYHGWPVITLEIYFNYLKENGFDYYERVGFKRYYFVSSADAKPSPEFASLIKTADKTTIFNKRNEEAFNVYFVSQ